MDHEALYTKIKAIVPDAEFPEETQFPEAIIPAEKLFELAKSLRDDPETRFDYLFCLTSVDWNSFFYTVYHLTSTSHNHTIVLKAKIEDHDHPAVDSVSSLWAVANFLEREVYDLMGIRFNNHPDLRRIFLEDDWVGHPLRKDYVDTINIVDL